MNTPITNCEDAIRRLALYIDGEIEPADRPIVERHIETCRSCFSRMEFEKRLKAQFAALRESAADPAFEERIRRMIVGFGERPSGHGSAPDRST
ncbi:MAG: zf-HC2 domain-containing protein [Gemmatimonadetes bacterium]|nr:zf-HC2 domain-containing protein [Gemmatimonadota bacterium]